MSKQSKWCALAAAFVLALTLVAGLFGGVVPAAADDEPVATASDSATDTTGAASGAADSESEADPADDQAPQAGEVYLLDFNAPELGAWDVPNGHYQVELGTTTIQDALDALNLSSAFQFGGTLDAADYGGDPSKHYQFLGWSAMDPSDHPIALEEPLEAEDFISESESTYVLDVNMMLQEFRPYTIQNGVLTFDDEPDLKYYQLTVELGEGVTWHDVIRPAEADKQEYYIFAPDIDAAWKGSITQSLFVREDATNLELGVSVIAEGNVAPYIYPSESVVLLENIGLSRYTFAVDRMTGPGVVRVTATPDQPTTDIPEPFGADGSLLPYTIEGGVMTFDGRPDLGEWYQLDVKVAAGMSFELVFGGTPGVTMTITPDMLDEDDQLYNSNPYSGTFFIRGENHGYESSILVSYPMDKALTWSLSAGSGTVRRIPGGSIFGVALDEPSELTFGTSSETVVTNDEGNSFSHTAGTVNEDGWTYADDDRWSSLTLVTDWLGGDIAEAAGDAVNAAISGVKKMYVYDIHLEDPVGNEFEIPDGDQVTVTLLIPEELRGASGLHVFHVADDGTVTDMNAVVDQEAGTLTFTTTHFSTFVIAQVAENGEPPAGGGKGDKLTQTSDNSLVPAAVAVAGAVLAFGAAAVVRHRNDA